MLENLNIQSIAKWLAKGCGNIENGNDECNNISNNEKGFYILECNDICLLSKLTDVKNDTLLERAHRKMKQIKDPHSRKDFLFKICNEFLRDGRRTVALAMITEELDSQSELYRMFRSELFFHRALCYLKHDQLTDALFDLYLAFQNCRIQSLDNIHVQILEEIKNFLKSHKFKEGFIVTKDKGQITFEQVMEQYESKICQFIRQSEQARRSGGEAINTNCTRSLSLPNNGNNKDSSTFKGNNNNKNCEKFFDNFVSDGKENCEKLLDKSHCYLNGNPECFREVRRVPFITNYQFTYNYRCQ